MDKLVKAACVIGGIAILSAVFATAAMIVYRVIEWAWGG